jgi:ketosteroid isomerase-like protein
LRTEFWLDEMTAVRRAVDGLLGGELDPLLGLLADEVEFEVAGGDEPGSTKESGAQAVADYFGALSGMVAFWQLDYSASGEQVIAWGKESFTLDRSGLEGGCEFALVFDLSDGRITRLQMIEDLPAFIRSGGTLAEAASGATRGRPAPETYALAPLTASTRSPAGASCRMRTGISMYTRARLIMAPSRS